MVLDLVDSGCWDQWDKILCFAGHLRGNVCLFMSPHPWPFGCLPHPSRPGELKPNELHQTEGVDLSDVRSPLSDMIDVSVHVSDDTLQAAMK